MKLTVSARSFEYLLPCVKVGVNSRPLNVRWVAQSEKTLYFSFKIVTNKVHQVIIFVTLNLGELVNEPGSNSSQLFY